MTYHSPFLRGAAAALLVGVAACADSITAPVPTGRPPLAAVAATPACDAGAFGPALFTRTAGAPTTAAATFAATPGTFYRLEASDRGTSGSNATVRLNGVELVTSRDLASQPRGSVELPVTLAASNTLEVRQTGRPGSQLELRIVDTRAAAAVRITPLMALLVEVAATRAYTAEVLDAEGRPLARCIAWSTTDPAVAAVGMDGIVRGVGVGSTELVARVDDVEARLPITVVQRAGPTQTASYLGYCAMNQPDASVPRACFDAILRTTPLVGDQTLIELSLRNRQGSHGAETLPGSSIHSVHVMGTTGTGPLPLLQAGFGAVGWLLSTSGAVGAVGSPTAMVGTGGVSYPPHPGGPSFQGTAISSLAVLGCSTLGSLTPPSYWRTCGDQAGLVDITFVSPNTWTAADLFLHLIFSGIEPVGQAQPGCSTRVVPGATTFPWDVCQPRLPALAS